MADTDTVYHNHNIEKGQNHRNKQSHKLMKDELNALYILIHIFFFWITIDINEKFTLLKYNKKKYMDIYCTKIDNFIGGNHISFKVKKKNLGGLSNNLATHTIQSSSIILKIKKKTFWLKGFYLVVVIHP